LSSGWTLIGSELSSPILNSSVRAERSFAIRYLNIVIKPLCGNLDICLNYYFRSRNSVRVVSVADHDRSERCFFELQFSISLLSSLAEKLEHANHLLTSIRDSLRFMYTEAQFENLIFFMLKVCIISVQETKEMTYNLMMKKNLEIKTCHAL